MTRHVLIIDDEPNMRWVLSKALEQAGYTVSSASGGDEGLAVLGREPIELVLLDLKLKGEDGITVLRRLRERRPDLVVMMLTAYGTVPNAVEAMQLGAADFLRKPFDVEEVVFKIARALERRSLQQEVARLSAVQHSAFAFKTLVGTEPVWQRAIAQARHLALLDLNCVIVGEPGTERGIFAGAMHTSSSRRDAPLVEADLTAYADPQRALFGTREGDGLWGNAGNGTLVVRGLLASPLIQQVIVEHLATAVAPPRVIVVATPEQAAAGIPTTLTPAQLTIPPLRERQGDILLLATTFAQGVAISPLAARQLELYSWPGNVAELRGVLQRARMLAQDTPIDVTHLPRQIADLMQPSPGSSFQLPVNGIHLEEVEQTLIRQALAQARGNKSKAAELLGLTRHTLLYRMEKYHIQSSDVE